MRAQFLCLRMTALSVMVFLLLFVHDGLASPLTTEADLAHGRIGTWPGSKVEEYARKIYPNAKFVYLDTVADMAQNLRQGKIDAFAMNRILVDELFYNGETGMEILGDSLGKTAYSFVFAYSDRGEKLCNEFNDFLQANRENGTLHELQQKWLNHEGNVADYKPPVLSGENGTLSVVINPIFPPMLFVSNGQFAGYEAELLARFCEAYGYDFKPTVATFEAAVGGVANGQFDIGMSSVEYIAEREEHVLFSNPTCEADCVLVVRSDGANSAGILDTLKKKIYDTLIRENRWKMLVNGMATTLVITFASVLLGSLGGFFLCLLYHEGNRIFNSLVENVSRFLQGMPVVVLLMTFYYIVFGSSNMSGVVVAIIVFSLIFAFGVFGMLKSGADSIPRGQTEGALALGFSERQAFVRFILPQAVRIFFRTYQTAIVDLLKSTAIVGYIAVQDLTKMADIIRARTFDAFAPLIAISVLYFLLAWLLKKITGEILIRLNPENRTAEEILPGVKL